jgi:hypothetical protein
VTVAPEWHGLRGLSRLVGTKQRIRVKSQYLSAEQIQQIATQHATLMQGADGSRTLQVGREQFGELVDAVIAAYASKFPAPIEDMVGELYLLEEVCAWYASDEDRYLNEDGEPYGSFPTEVGLKARSARKRFEQREAEEAAKNLGQAG